MKKFSILFLIFFSFSFSHGQEGKKENQIINWEKVEQPPVFQDCKNSKQANCSEQFFANFVQTNFDPTVISDSISDPIITFKYIVGKEGKLKWSSIKSSRPEIEKEGKRILNLLPAYLPGEENGKPVNVINSLRIQIKTNRENPINKSLTTYPGPKKCKNKKDKKQCLSYYLSNYVNRRFNTDIVKATKEKITIYKTWIKFVIDKSGAITNIDAKGSNKKMNKEAIRVIKTIPKMQPGRIEGKAVDVDYSMPIAVGKSR